METRIALLGVLIEDESSVEQVNQLMHEYGKYIVGRMGVPYRQRGVNIISLVLDAPENKISALAGKLGQLPGVSVKSMLAKTGKGE